MADAASIEDLARLARKRLPRIVFDYLEGGSEDEVTLRANRTAFARVCLVPEVLTGHSRRDLRATLLGQQFALPVLIGPTGLSGIFWPDADVALARAAASVGAGFVLSTPANTAIERVAAACPGTIWFQLYPWGERAHWLRLIERAGACGVRTLIVTVDSLVAGKRERDLRNRFAHEVRYTPRAIWDGLTHPRWLATVWLRRGVPHFENISEFLPPGADARTLAEFTRARRNAGFSWSDLGWIREHWSGPLIVKGILTAADAARAADAGVNGVVVSNHGGRQLDGAQATLDALPAVAAKAGHALTVLVDGGIRRGSDVVKAIALGARGVLLGRATLYGLAAGGEAGVARALVILRDEIERVLALIGCATIADVSARHVEVAGAHTLRTRTGCGADE
ncbi:MAG: alpha-hydroxy-acid oxidizing protein [Burkholderiales bacterium]|nr:alpha-hydroxy-acid oxidizing protein [Burkholderiales bacterium]